MLAGVVQTETSTTAVFFSAGREPTLAPLCLFFARSTRIALAADERRDYHAPAKASLPPQSEAVACREACAQEEDKKKIQGDFISILGSGSKKKRKKEEVPMFSPPFVSQLINFQKLLKRSSIPERTETHQEFSRQSWLAPGLHHEGLPWSSMEVG